jgi:hypothetical protein
LHVRGTIALCDRDLEVTLKAHIDNDRDSMGKAGMLETAWHELPLFVDPSFAKSSYL